MTQAIKSLAYVCLFFWVHGFESYVLANMTARQLSKCRKNTYSKVSMVAITYMHRVCDKIAKKNS